MEWGEDGPVARYLSAGLRELLGWIFQRDPAKRPTIKDLSEHVWMQGTLVQDDGEYWQPKVCCPTSPPPPSRHLGMPCPCR